MFLWGAVDLNAKQENHNRRKFNTQITDLE